MTAKNAKCYKQGLRTKAMVRNAALKAKITAEVYANIVGDGLDKG